jgi:hypothetical protein
MGADIITLDGLPVGREITPPKQKECGELVEVYLGVLDQNVRVCQRDLDRLETAPKLVKRRGRPRGSTVKNGAKAPKVGACQVTKIVTRKDGRRMCKCADSNNSRILKNEVCGI